MSKKITTVNKNFLVSEVNKALTESLPQKKGLEKFFDSPEAKELLLTLMFGMKSTRDQIIQQWTDARDYGEHELSYIQKAMDKVPSITPFEAFIFRFLDADFKVQAGAGSGVIVNLKWKNQIFEEIRKLLSKHSKKINTGVSYSSKDSARLEKSVADFLEDAYRNIYVKHKLTDAEEDYSLMNRFLSLIRVNPNVSIKYNMTGKPNEDLIKRISNAIKQVKNNRDSEVNIYNILQKGLTELSYPLATNKNPTGQPIVSFEDMKRAVSQDSFDNTSKWMRMKQRLFAAAFVRDQMKENRELMSSLISYVDALISVVSFIYLSRTGVKLSGGVANFLRKSLGLADDIIKSKIINLANASTSTSKLATISSISEILVSFAVAAAQMNDLLLGRFQRLIGLNNQFFILLEQKAKGEELGYTPEEVDASEYTWDQIKQIGTGLKDLAYNIAGVEKDASELEEPEGPPEQKKVNDTDFNSTIERILLGSNDIKSIINKNALTSTGDRMSIIKPGASIMDTWRDIHVIISKKLGQEIIEEMSPGSDKEIYKQFLTSPAGAELTEEYTSFMSRLFSLYQKAIESSKNKDLKGLNDIKDSVDLEISEFEDALQALETQRKTFDQALRVLKKEEIKVKLEMSSKEKKSPELSGVEVSIDEVSHPVMKDLILNHSRNSKVILTEQGSGDYDPKHKLADYRNKSQLRWFGEGSVINNIKKSGSYWEITNPFEDPVVKGNTKQRKTYKVSPEVAFSLQNLFKAMEDVEFDFYTVKITSALRSGHKERDHAKGNAIDIKTGGGTAKKQIEMLTILKSLGTGSLFNTFGLAGSERDSMHLGYRPAIGKMWWYYGDWGSPNRVQATPGATGQGPVWKPKTGKPDSGNDFPKNKYDKENMPPAILEIVNSDAFKQWFPRQPWGTETIDPGNERFSEIKKILKALGVEDIKIKEIITTYIEEVWTQTKEDLINWVKQKIKDADEWSNDLFRKLKVFLEEIYDFLHDKYNKTKVANVTKIADIKFHKPNYIKTKKEVLELGKDSDFRIIADNYLSNYGVSAADVMSAANKIDNYAKKLDSGDLSSFYTAKKREFQLNILNKTKTRRIYNSEKYWNIKTNPKDVSNETQVVAKQVSKSFFESLPEGEELTGRSLSLSNVGPNQIKVEVSFQKGVDFKLNNNVYNLIFVPSWVQKAIAKKQPLKFESIKKVNNNLEMSLAVKLRTGGTKSETVKLTEEEVTLLLAQSINLQIGSSFNKQIDGNKVRIKRIKENSSNVTKEKMGSIDLNLQLVFNLKDNGKLPPCHSGKDNTCVLRASDDISEDSPLHKHLTNFVNSTISDSSLKIKSTNPFNLDASEHQLHNYYQEGSNNLIADMTVKLISDTNTIRQISKEDFQLSKLMKNKLLKSLESLDNQSIGLGQIAGIGTLKKFLKPIEDEQRKVDKDKSISILEFYNYIPSDIKAEFKNAEFEKPQVSVPQPDSKYQDAEFIKRERIVEEIPSDFLLFNDGTRFVATFDIPGNGFEDFLSFNPTIVKGIDFFDMAAAGQRETERKELLLMLKRNLDMFRTYLESLERLTVDRIAVKGMTMDDYRIYREYFKNYIKIFKYGIRAIENKDSNTSLDNAIRSCYHINLMAAAIYNL